MLTYKMFAKVMTQEEIKEQIRKVVEAAAEVENKQRQDYCELASRLRQALIYKEQTEPIRVKVFDEEVQTFIPEWYGAYPYDCQTAEEHPNSMVYYSEAGGWVASHQLEMTDKGYYRVK